MSAERIREAALSGDVEYLRRNSKRWDNSCSNADARPNTTTVACRSTRCWPGREMLQALYDAGGDFDEGAMVAAIDSVNLDAIAFLAELAQRGDWAARFVPLEDFDEIASIGPQRTHNSGRFRDPATLEKKQVPLRFDAVLDEWATLSDARVVMDSFQTGLCDCFKSVHTTAHGRVVNTSRWVTLKAFFCPCILLGETRSASPLNARTRYTARIELRRVRRTQRALGCVLATTTSPYLDECTLGAAALYASERDAPHARFRHHDRAELVGDVPEGDFLHLLRARTRVA